MTSKYFEIIVWSDETMFAYYLIKASLILIFIDLFDNVDCENLEILSETEVRNWIFNLFSSKAAYYTKNFWFIPSLTIERLN